MRRSLFKIGIVTPVILTPNIDEVVLYNMEPATRIERATCGLRMEPVEQMKDSVFHMVSPFILTRKGVPAFLSTRLILNDSVCFTEFQHKNSTA